jgi:hypothetical protein
MDRKDHDRENAGKNPIIHHDDNPGVGDHVGEAAGGISGVLAGAAIGSAGGPIGTIIGGIAGAVGGWWSGRAVSEAATRLTHDDDKYYRGHYEGSPSRLADRNYDDVRPAYHLGHIAANNPDYKDRDFDAVESDLRRGWDTKHGEWDSMRGYARHGFEYGRGRSGATNASASSYYGTAAGATAGGLADRAARGVDNLKDRVDGNPASRPGLDPTDRGMSASGTADRVGDATENAWDRTKNAASNLGNKAVNAADNLKDRVDGNPASKPGPDSTDRRF